MEETKTTTDTATASDPPAVDTAFAPTSYWGTEAHPKRVEIASVDWNGEQTFYLDALHHTKQEIGFKWRIDGDHEELPDDIDSLTEPMALADLMEVLEENCLPVSSLEEAWDMGWAAEAENVDYTDSDSIDSSMDTVRDAYTFQSSVYPTLGSYYEERFQAWRDQQDVSVE